jgi:hypothetical protein
MRAALEAPVQVPSQHYIPKHCNRGPATHRGNLRWRPSPRPSRHQGEREVGRAQIRRHSDGGSILPGSHSGSVQRPGTTPGNLEGLRPGSRPQSPAICARMPVACLLCRAVERPRPRESHRSFALWRSLSQSTGAQSPEPSATLDRPTDQSVLSCCSRARPLSRAISSEP